MKNLPMKQWKNIINVSSSSYGSEDEDDNMASKWHYRNDMWAVLKAWWQSIWPVVMIFSGDDALCRNMARISAWWWRKSNIKSANKGGNSSVWRRNSANGANERLMATTGQLKEQPTAGVIRRNPTSSLAGLSVRGGRVCTAWHAGAARIGTCKHCDWQTAAAFDGFCRAGAWPRRKLYRKRTWLAALRQHGWPGEASVLAGGVAGGGGSDNRGELLNAEQSDLFSRNIILWWYAMPVGDIRDIKASYRLSSIVAKLAAWLAGRKAGEAVDGEGCTTDGNRRRNAGVKKRKPLAALMTME